MLQKWAIQSEGKAWRHVEHAADGKRRLFPGLASHHRAVNFETAGLGDHFVEAKRLIQHLRIRQEGVSNDTQFAAAVQMADRAADQRLRRFKTGLQASWNGGFEMIMSKRR